MNTAPIFAVCKQDATVKSLLEDDGVLRLFMFGLAPQDVKKPYAVWQVVSGSPENYLHCRPTWEQHALQIDVYADSATEARTISAAIEKAIELDCYITGYNAESRDPETKNYRSGFDVNWITYR